MPYGKRENLSCAWVRRQHMVQSSRYCIHAYYLYDTFPKMAIVAIRRTISLFFQRDGAMRRMPACSVQRTTQPLVDSSGAWQHRCHWYVIVLQFLSTQPPHVMRISI